jgi:arabinogalactan endo-1,4-beta-galactosidase
MEADGMRFFNSAGQERECMELMKETGMNSIRLRVWVNPQNGWCGKDDVLEKALRAKALGMKLMIDFHYSDTWADPGKQNPPAAWYGYSSEQIRKALEDHTESTLNILKNNNIEVGWVQIGNEVNSGMLHPYGKVQGTDAGDFVSLFNAGSRKVRKIYPEAKVILHLSNGHDPQLYTWFLNTVHGVEYDMIGMSIYPSWNTGSGWIDWRPAAQSCISNIKSVAKIFGKPVMICETGMPAAEAQMARDAMEYLIKETAAIPECHGIAVRTLRSAGDINRPGDYASRRIECQQIFGCLQVSAQRLFSVCFLQPLLSVSI